MPQVACPVCGARQGIVRFKKNQRCYVRCKTCRSDRTEREARAAAAAPQNDHDDSPEEGWGGDEPVSSFPEHLYPENSESTIADDAAQMLLSLSTTIDNVPDANVDARISVSVTHSVHGNIESQERSTQTVAAARLSLPAIPSVPTLQVDDNVAGREPHIVSTDDVGVLPENFTTRFLTTCFGHYCEPDCDSHDDTPSGRSSDDAASSKECDVEQVNIVTDVNASGDSLLYETDDCQPTPAEIPDVPCVGCSALDESTLGTTAMKLVFEAETESPRYSASPDIDGYRILLSQGLPIGQRLLVRYAPQKIEHRPANVSFKIGRRRMHGTNLVLYRLGKVDQIRCKLFICLAFTKGTPPVTHIVKRSLHSAICKALQGIDPAAPSRSLSIEHGLSHGEKEKHAVKAENVEAFMAAVMTHCKRITLPNSQFEPYFMLERFGQKFVSSIDDSVEDRMLQLIVSRYHHLLVDGCIDLGVMFKADSPHGPQSLFWDRSFLHSTYGKNIRLHSKSFISNLADGTMKYGASSPVLKEKFYTTDVYLWRTHGKIPYRLLDPSSQFLRSIPMFCEGLPLTMQRLLEENERAAERDLSLVRAAFESTSSTPVCARYEITVVAKHYLLYRTAIHQLCVHMPRKMNESRPLFLHCVSSKDYGRFLFRISSFLIQKSLEHRDMLRQSIFQKACAFQAEESGYGRVFSGTEDDLAFLCVYQDLFLLLLTGDSVHLRFRVLMKTLNITELMRSHGIVGKFDRDAVRRAVRDVRCPFEYLSFFYAWAYPLIKRQRSSVARELICFRLTCWLESCIVYSVNRMQLQSYAHRTCVCRRALHNLFKEILILVDMKNVTGKVLRDQFFTEATLLSFGLLDKGPADINVYLTVLFPKRHPFENNVVKSLSSTCLLSLVTSSSSEFESMRSALIDRAIQMSATLRFRYHIECLPHFTSSGYAKQSPTMFYRWANQGRQLTITPSTEDPTDIRHKDDAMRCILWMVEAMKRRVISVLRPAGGPNANHERIVQAFYAILRYQVGVDANYAVAQKAIEAALRGNTKRELQRLEVFCPTCFSSKRCNQWKLIAYGMLKARLESHTNDVEKSKLEAMSTTHLPIFVFDESHGQLARIAGVPQAVKLKRGRPRKRPVPVDSDDVTE
jgi:hypothetical protein